MNRASFEIAEFKTPTDGPKGLFAALVSVFGNVDYNGDRVMPGAFGKSLKRWKESGRPIPVIWSHQHNNPVDYVGSVQPDDVKENSKGLVVAGKLDIEDNENARRIYNLLKKGYVKEWSFGYEVKDERIADDAARDLLEVDLIEVGPTLKGANPDTRTLAVASANLEETTSSNGSNVTITYGPKPQAETEPALELAKLDPLLVAALSSFEGEIDTLIEEKIGRVMSAKTESRLRAAIAALEEALSQLGKDQPEEASSTPAVKSPAEGLPGENERLRLALSDAGVFLAERNG